MNRHNTFVWPRHASREHFHTRMLPFYLDEEAFDKEVMSWPGVKRGPHKSGMHYIFPVELLKKKDKEAGEGPSSGPEQKKPDALTQTDSEEEEEIPQLERRKRPPPDSYQTMLCCQVHRLTRSWALCLVLNQW
jgi:hypothetical protein